MHAGWGTGVSSGHATLRATLGTVCHAIWAAQQAKGLLSRLSAQCPCFPQDNEGLLSHQTVRSKTVKLPCLQVAPAMNTFMWQSPFTDEHITKLEGKLGVKVIPPIQKVLACGDVGTGAMAEPEVIAAELERILTNAGCDQHLSTGQASDNDETSRR